MIIEIAVSVIAFSFLILVIFLIYTLKKANKTLKKADRALGDIHDMINALAISGPELMHNTNKLILDIKKKSEGLDILFHPLYALKKEKSEIKSTYEKITEIIGFVSEGIQLFTKIRNEKIK